MKLPRELSGARLVERLCGRWDYRLVNQSGSHIVVETDVPSRHRVAIPNHRSLRVGTLHQILKSIALHKGVSRQKILDTL